MPKQTTPEAIFLFRCLMEIYIEACKNFNMVFLDLEKATIRSLKGLSGGFWERKESI